jgi:5-(carboxyamino)imidazole ribonucleotide synthase
MRIGIIGAGQLGQMLGFAARKMGHECYFLDPSEAPPAAQAGPVAQASFDDPVALSALADKCDVLTYEFENVPVEALEAIASERPVYPPLGALRVAQDRLTEKQLFERLEIPLPSYHAIDSLDDLRTAADSIGLPLVLKTRRFGYDGKGQFVIKSPDQVDAAWRELGGKPLIAEEWVAFDYEVSAIGVRAIDGNIAAYCLSRNEHSGGILRTSRAPLDDRGLTAKAGGYLTRMLEDLDYVGVLALELFVVGDDLFANEFAPRVHNSGHWTIEGAETSQFANHILAVAGEEPASTANIGHAGMVNLIGEIPDAARHLDAGVLHDYGKTARPGRKLGHITIVADSADDRDSQVAEIVANVT